MNRIVHIGDPMPWPRAGARIVTARNGEQFIQHYTPAEATKRQAEIAECWTGEAFPSGVPLLAELVFVFARPAGHIGAHGIRPAHLRSRPGYRGKNAHGQRTGADLDNCIKLTLDALNGRAYVDDGQIAEIHADKLYVDQAGVTEPQTVVEIGVVQTAGVQLLAEVA